MTKLKFKIKQGAKKRSHRNKVAKRRDQREKSRLQTKKEQEEQREEEDEFMQMVKEAQQNQPSSHLQALPSSLLVSSNIRGVAAVAPGKKKEKNLNLTRKQMKRKEKSRDKAEALSEQRVEKIMGKMTRVKHRARVRNSDLKN